MTSERRAVPPPPLEPISFDLPLPHEYTMENGLRVVLVANDRLPLVSFRLAFDFGDASEPTDAVGINSAMASMLLEGTENYTSQQLAEKIERLGASIGASSSDDFTIVSASTLSLYSSEVLRLLAEAVLRPTFPDGELDLYRRNTIENLKYQRSQPNFLASEQAAKAVYGEHPYSRVSPSAADVEKLDRETILQYHTKRFVPNNACLIVVGDVDGENFRSELDEAFGAWPAGEAAAVEFPEIKPRSGRTLTIVDRPGSAQSNIVIANQGIERTHEDYFPVLVMNQVLGAGASSRVFMNLREEKGYTYGAYTRVDTKRFAGDIEATAEVRTSVTGDSLKEFFCELGRIREEVVGDEELEDAKNFLTGVFPLRAETQEGVTNLIVNQYLYGLPEDYLQTYRHRVESVTAEQVQEAARSHIRPDTAAVIIVGDAEQVLPQAREYATSVEIVDINGQKQDESKYVSAIDAPASDVGGKWALEIDLQGQKLPVGLELVQDGETVTGTLETMLGKGTISDGQVSGSKLSATATAEIQGQPVIFAITGKVDGDSMTGTLSAPIAPEQLTFTGTR